jgi:hypothetical protein
MTGLTCFIHIEQLQKFSVQPSAQEQTKITVNNGVLAGIYWVMPTFGTETEAGLTGHCLECVATMGILPRELVMMPGMMVLPCSLSYPPV